MAAVDVIAYGLEMKLFPISFTNLMEQVVHAKFTVSL